MRASSRSPHRLAAWACVLAVAVLAPDARAAGDGPPPAAAPATITLPRLVVPHTLFALPNGLRVVVHEDRSVPLVSVNLWYHVGSAREKPGRTGFAHLFEHLMFEGSKHVPEGAFDSLLEAAGGQNNGSTSTDRTNYFITVPSNALELALFLESDRMGYLLDAMSPALVDGQRDVVKNERRQSYENQPYGMAWPTLGEMLYPPSHPYHWPTIGYMEDLAAASYADVVEFYRAYYGPNNATLVIAGDVDTAAVRPLVEKWFSDVGRGRFVEPLTAPPAVLSEIKRQTLTDQVQLPRLYLAWHSPAHFAPGDAELDVVASVLAGGKNSRLFRRLVYDLQVAQDVTAFQSSADLGSRFVIVVTARPGQALDGLRALVDEEITRLADAPPEPREVERALNGIEAGFYARMERVSGFGGKADLLNAYLAATGNPDYFTQDLARYLVLGPRDVQAAVRAYLPLDRRVELSIVPEGDPEAPTTGAGETR
jgi:zinc protease